MSDSEIREGMKRSGIPDFVVPTTLPKEGHQDVRDLIQTRAYMHNSLMFGFYTYWQRSSSVTKARRTFYLIAKEMYLSGVKVYCTSLAGLVEALTTQDYSYEAYAMDNVDMIFVSDFYEDQAPCPLTPAESSRVRAWARAVFEDGRAVSFLGDSPPDRCGSWWPDSFMRFIAEHSLVVKL